MCIDAAKCMLLFSFLENALRYVILFVYNKNKEYEWAAVYIGI